MSGPHKVKVMVVAGESGGHILPAVGFCQEFKERSKDPSILIFVTTGNYAAEGLIPSEFNPVFLKISKSPLGLLKLIFFTFYLILTARPDVVFGFGGYIAVPFVVLARLSGKKTLIHEQNVVPGRANRFLSGWADKIAVSFAATQGYFKKRKNVFLAHYPLRRSLNRADKTEALRFFGFQDGMVTILAMGGSQGAHKINEVFAESLKNIKNLEKIQVIHLTGRTDFSMVQGAYNGLPLKSKVFAFLNEMNYAYSAADLVISRSGAGSVIEIMRFGLPSILIPYPYAGAHQIENARVLAEKGAAILLEEDKATPSVLCGLLDIFIDDRMRRKTMSAIAAALYETSANLKLCDLISSPAT
jgi:UDP-N-acetylglucosamine--N-acetylmuramyl-(pentapeptide) pyrophosphoryl-undecaprenol N-acetylglucosamine transferase